MQLRTRIAPTPSGYLHMGNAFDFILIWLLARKENGHILLRIDDLDAPRVREKYLEEIFETLRWLGLDYDAGPQDVQELKNEWSQQLRLPLYYQTLELLVQTGRVYACKCSRKELEICGPIACSCEARHFSLEEKEVAWRFKTLPEDVAILKDLKLGTKAVNIHEVNPNFIIRRKDGIPAYHVASLTDDAAWQINFIVRGQDLWESSATQLLLAQCLGLEHFIKTRFCHHPLIRDAGGEKLSKSAGAASLKALRESGRNKSFIFQEFGTWLQLPFSADSARELLAQLQKDKGIFPFFPA